MMCADALFDLIQIKRKESIDVPRGFGDYEVTVDQSALPQGITLIRKVG